MRKKISLDLDHQETAIAHLLSTGYQVKEICQIVGVSEHRYKHLLVRSKRKTGVKTSCELVGFCIRKGVIK